MSQHFTVDQGGTKDARHKPDESQSTEKNNFYLKVCRVCLATQVNIYNINEHRLGDMYKQVTGIEVNEDDNLPQVLCWECVARLWNASNFIEKALRTRWILTNSQINNGKPLTIDSIITMNKTEYGLNSTLGYKHFNGNYADAHIVHETEAKADDSSSVGESQRIDEAQYSKSKPYFDEKVDKVTNNSKRIFTNNDTASVVTYRDESANNSGIKIEPIDIDIDTENEQSVKEECLSDEEMDQSNNERSQYLIKEVQFNDIATSEDNNESHTSIKDRIKFEDNIETITNNVENGYTCDICNKTFNCKTNIIQHLENHPEIFSCSFCAYKTYREDHLTAHTNTEHRSKDFHCPLCKFKTYNKDTLQQHIHKRHSKNKLYSCTFCAFTGYNKSVLNKHIIANHINKAYLDCDFCDFKTLYHGHLQQHIKTKHTKSIALTCTFCNFMTHDRNALGSHINSKHIKNTIYKCSYCNYAAQQKYHLTKHIEANHT